MVGQVAELPTFVTSAVASSPPHYLNVCPGTGHCIDCQIHVFKILVGMTSDVTELGLLQLLGCTVLTQLTSYRLLVATSHFCIIKDKTSSIPKKGIPKLDGALRADHCSLAWTDQRVCSTEQLVKRLCNYA